jgi:hypothetical protein
MVSNIFITSIFILIGLLLIKAVEQNYPPLFEIWLIKLLKRFAGEKGVIIFYYLTGIVIILIGIFRLLYGSLK